jgi:hypothetical protein
LYVKADQVRILSGPLLTGGRYASLLKLKEEKMSNEPKEYDIGEFVSFELSSNKGNGKFTITLVGDIKYEDMIATKIGNLKISEKEFNEWREDFV